MTLSENQSSGEANLRIYEIGYLIAPTVPQEKVAGEVSAIKDVIANNQGIFIAEDFPKLRVLAYTIAKNISGRRQNFNQAYFGWLKFEIDALVSSAVKSALEKNENLLRYLFISTVRESTMIPPKTVSRKADIDRGDSKDGKKAEAVKSPISEAELDKTIEELIVE